MPVILHAHDEEDWLNAELGLQDAQALLVPYPGDLMTAYEVSPKVNSATNYTPDVIARV